MGTKQIREEASFCLGAGRGLRTGDADTGGGAFRFSDIKCTPWLCRAGVGAQQAPQISVSCVSTGAMVGVHAFLGLKMEWFMYRK